MQKYTLTHTFTKIFYILITAINGIGDDRKLMPQLDLTFFFSSALTVNIGFLVLLYGFDAYIVPKMAEAIKWNAKELTFTANAFPDDFVETMHLDLSDVREFYDNCNKKIVINNAI